MQKRVVAISTTHGSEGRRIGGLVAQLLEFGYVDEQIITIAAEKRGIDPEVVADAEKRKSLVLRVLEGLGEGGGGSGAIGGGPMWVPDDSSELARSYDLRSLIIEAIRETASRGDVVIVAHAASFALAGREDLLRVFVTAPLEARVRRIAQLPELDDAQAEREVKRSDTARADYLKRFYGVERELPTHYDLVVNSEVMEPETAAGVIARAVEG
ncbi:MAG: cytidylate kinase-like family protein [Actinobacteria bacterium]|nr:cytidylate kinase-like family protein [Actinomycetota bacterium]